MIAAYLEAASSYAQSVDNLVFWITVIVGFWFILCEVVFFGFLFRFRRKPGEKADYITGEEHEYARFIHWPHYLIIFCDLFIIWGAVQVWYNIKQDLPPADQTVRVIGQQWAWSFVHPGPDGQIDTADDIKTVDELRLQNDTTYHFQLEARDVLHSFSIPVFRLKQDAVPGRVITGWFKPIKTGTYDIQCAEICGVGHGIMGGRVVVEDKQQHAAWMASQASNQLAAAPPQSASGAVGE